VWTAAPTSFSPLVNNSSFTINNSRTNPNAAKNCKGKRAQALGLPQNGGNYQRVETKAVCSGCQRETTVPFKPTQGRPVFCRECFQQRKTTAATA